jgi:hypothetical protein
MANTASPEETRDEEEVAMNKSYGMLGMVLPEV